MPVTVTALAFAPVKGMRVVPADELQLEREGARGDRAFLVVGEDGELVSTSRTPELVTVVPSYDAAANVLRLAFPGGTEAEAEVAPGAAATTRLYDGREVAGHLVDGPLAAALSEHLGRRVRLLARAAGTQGADDFPVTLMSLASLRALAPELDGAVPDARRFRMTLTVDGVEAWEEHGWTGRELAAGEAGLRVVDPVPRCVVTTRHPEQGRTDAPVLKALARLRGPRDVTFGVWCEVTRPGRVRVGDPVTAA